MIGRGARGKPWVLAQIAHDVFGTPAPVIPSADGFADMVRMHYAAMIRFYGHDLGLRVARKHLGWYMDTCGAPQDIRKAVLTAPDVKTTDRLLGQACHLPEQVAA